MTARVLGCGAGRWGRGHTRVVPVVAGDRFLALDSEEQRGDQTLVGLQVEQHQLRQRLETLRLHALRSLRGRGVKRKRGVDKERGRMPLPHCFTLNVV